MPILEILTKLIAFDTTSNKSNLAFMNYVAQLLAEHAIKAHILPAKNPTKAALFADIVPAKAVTQKGIIFSAHSDVVPVSGQNWATDPFHLQRQDDKVFGRGVTDMKGFIAVILALLPQLKTCPFPLHLALSYDEEVGCAGTKEIFDFLTAKQQQFLGCIVGEPTSLQLVTSHKGINLFSCRLTGKSVHSSLTNRGCNAIEFAAELIQFISTKAQSFAQQGPFNQAFDVPYTSLTNNLITGGNAVNIVPSECEIIYEFRNLPEADHRAIQQEIESFAWQQILPAMRAKYPEATIQFKPIAQAPAFWVAENNSFVSLLAKALANPNTAKVAYATEAGLFSQFGIPAVVCGPGSIEQAHIPNEYIQIEQLTKYQDFLLNLSQAQT